MSGYKILSLIQAIILLFYAVVVFDGTGMIGLIVAFGFAAGTAWSVAAFGGYVFAALAIFQLVKVFTVKEGE